MVLELEYPIVLSVHLFFLWKSGFKFEHFQNGVFDLHRQLHVNFPITQFFVKATDIQNM